MANVTQGLFGFDPSQVAQQRDDQLQAQAVQHASMSPVQAARVAMFRAGSQLGGAGASLMGVKDPELEAQSLMRQTASTLDLNDHKAVRDVANTWLKSGNPTLQNKALQLNDVADKAEQSFNERAKEKATNELNARKAANQAAFSQEYSAAPDADARLAVTRKYADMPELIKLDAAAMDRKEKAEIAKEARAEKAQDRKDAQAALFEQQRFLAGENNKARASASSDARLAAGATKQASADLKATLAQEKINNTNEKSADMDAKAARSAITNVSHADAMIATVKDAKELVRFDTTGNTGALQAKVNPGGDAGLLRNRIGTIKANIGFDALARMRAESPTGGALGQVAVQELEALQASVASLSPLQSDKELNKNLDKVAKHYDGWKKTVVEDQAARDSRRGGQQSINIPGATARNKPTAAANATSTGWGKAVEH